MLPSNQSLPRLPILKREKGGVKKKRKSHAKIGAVYKTFNRLGYLQRGFTLTNGMLKTATLNFQAVKSFTRSGSWSLQTRY
jgi:hypothetical protein